MADQQHWFKLWCSAPSDDDLLALEPALRWAWAAFGCYTKLHGTKGRVKVSASNSVLAAQMGVALSELKTTIELLPHMSVETHEKRYGEFTVTWQNWNKYQVDSTAAERMKTLRSKKRREEKRREERNPPEVPPASQNGEQSPQGHRPAAGLTVDEAVRKYQPLDAYRRIDVRQAALNCQNWCVTRKKAFSDRRLVNWLNGEAMKAARGGPDPYVNFPREVP